MRRRQREQLESIYLRVMAIRTQLERQYQRIDRIELLLHEMAPNKREVLFSKPEMDVDEWYEENKLSLHRLAQKGAL